MSERFQLPLPMWRVQFQLLGGGRRMLAIGVICTALLIFGTFAMRRLFLTDPFPAVAGWVLASIAATQALILILGGCHAVYRAMLRDYETKMIESHRLTPMSGIGVVLGYVFGSTLQITMLFALLTSFGTILSLLAALPAPDWVLGNLVLLTGAVSLWAAVVFAGMRVEKPFNPAPLVVGIAALYVPILFVPGAAFLFNVYTVTMGMGLITFSTVGSPSAAAIPAGISLILAAFWVSTAAARYRRPDLPAMNAVRGLAFLALALLIGTAGIVGFELMPRTWMGSPGDLAITRGQWTATMIGALLLASVVVACSVKCRLLVAQGAAVRDWSDRMSDLLVTLLAVLLICVVMAAVGTTVWPELLLLRSGGLERTKSMTYTWGFAMAACLVSLLTIRSLFELVHASVKSASLVSGLFIVAVWGIPPLVDLARAEYMREHGGKAVYSMLLGCSPAGSIIAAWSRIDVSLLPGLVAQGVLLVVLIYLARRTRGKPRSTAPL